MTISCNMYMRAIKQRFIKLIEENNLSSAFIDLIETLEIDNSDGSCYNHNNDIESEHYDYDSMATNINVKLGKSTINFYYCFQRAYHENMPWYITHVSHNHESNHNVISKSSEKICRRTITNDYEPNLKAISDSEFMRYMSAHHLKNLETLHQIILNDYNVTVIELHKFLGLLSLQFADILDKLHLTFTIDNLDDEENNNSESYQYENNKYRYEETNKKLKNKLSMSFNLNKKL